ncbi:MAG: S8 family serine peptidase [Flavobacteriaceae bacterium]|nr:S8 family serine peptidase [Flavobacteriaceae bacterium]
MKTFFFSSPKRSVVLFALIFGLTTVFSFGQSGNIVQFQDETIEIVENIQTFEWNQMPEFSQIDNGYVGWVQFHETPNQEVQDSFKANNLLLLEYIPHKTYLFYFPANTSISYLANSGVRAIVPVEGRFKLSEKLKNGDIDEYAQSGSNIRVTLQYHEFIDPNFVISDLAEKQISVIEQYKGSNNIDLLIPDNCLEDLSNMPYVKWVELIVAPDVKDDTQGKTIHRSAGLDTQTPGGRNYTGVGVGVMVRDDGIVGPHIDFHGRIDNSGASGSGPTHGDGVAGIMTGAGNLNPNMRGMAAGSDVYIVNYQANFLDTQTQNLINSGDAQITNSSYSNGCNAGYTTITQTVDQQTRDIPSLLHVFSAGNSNNNNCGYGAGSQWGNITGGHKQGKNVIATANVFFNGGLVNSSSRGPAADGRIKPDITAHGQGQMSTDENNEYMSFGGTSGAAPGIAGVAAQLYEAYADANGGVLPQSALIKAAMLNTANDYGNVGPDFKFGWGIVNGLRAGMLIEDGRYLSANISNGGTNNHSITVPAGTKQLRIMAYWSDAAASPGAGPALVNDLDLVVTDPSATDYLPWILDHTPDPTALDTPATTGVDHLNNMEQVLINDPAAGTYNAEISGFNVPVGPQEYFIVYEIITENLTLTYPNDGEHFTPGSQENLHWDAINTTSDFVLEYSTDNGSNWNPIATVGASETNYLWTVPAQITGQALVRITSGSFQDESDDVFSIARTVTGITLDEACLTDATFSWNPVVDAESYDFYILGAQYMEVVGTTNTNSITVPISSPDDDIWYAAVAKNATEGWESQRSIAELYNGGLFNCNLVDNLNLVSINNTGGDFTSACGASDGIVSITVRNGGSNPQSNFMMSYQLSGEPAVQEMYSGTLNSGEEIIFDFTTPLVISTNGSFTLTATIDLIDEYLLDNEKTLDFNAQVEATATPFEEPFDANGFPPNVNWSIVNPDELFTWEQKGPIGTGGVATLAAWVDNYSYNAPGEEDWLVTEIFDVTNLENGTLTFDLAKAQYSSTLFDGLRVDVSIDCGTTFETIYFKEDLDLSTIPNYNTTNDWEPSSPDEWRNEEIDISAYTGGSAIFRFVNINGYGNSTFIDNININGTIVLATNDFGIESIAMYPNPANSELNIDLGSISSEDMKTIITNNLGQVVAQFDAAIFGSDSKAVIDVSAFSIGLYFVKIQNQTEATTKKLIIR